MVTKFVVITGAIMRRMRRSSWLADKNKTATNWRTSSALWVRKQSSFAPTFATKDDVLNLMDKTVELFGRRSLGCLELGASIYVARKHAVEGLTFPWPWKGQFLSCVSTSIALGPIQTGMLDRFTGNEEKKSALVSSVPLRRIGTGGGRVGYPIRRVGSGVLPVGSGRSSA
ncbi:hypothetical protein POJ06DRAFT_271387 [Lipomyces tetrasporus]|uniref:Uncharacterized protein n=1 Tax=Lipomyces tetrasporus TaxID=54092 RepID=A0AAD7QKZ4_9ASCO|nr:uncharacterized protein POJ06DRAFT_271387 [Lipomyces tetrasporus]KAJ8097019.1 hypothetical protein POJ06DRAFT_271387 [Lipomyces tetrasporus]